MKRLPVFLPAPSMDKFLWGSVWRYQSGQLYSVIRVEGVRVYCQPVQPDGVTPTPMRKPRMIAARNLHHLNVPIVRG